MLALLRTIHVLSVALWFGSVAFFTVAGVLIFTAFENESLKPERTRDAKSEKARDAWFPVPPAYQKEVPPESNFPDPLRREQGSRAAGVAVSGIFPVYFPLQAGCGGMAVLTALALAWRQGGRLNAVRLAVCVLALAAALGGWWLEQRVHELRVPRNEKTDAVLLADAPTSEQIAEARAARAEFGKWHGISLLANFATLGLTLIAAGLAGHYLDPSARPPDLTDERTETPGGRDVLAGERARADEQIRLMMEKARADAARIAEEELAKVKAELAAERMQFAREIATAHDQLFREIAAERERLLREFGGSD